MNKLIVSCLIFLISTVSFADSLVCTNNPTIYEGKLLNNTDLVDQATVVYKFQTNDGIIVYFSFNNCVIEDK